MRSPVGPRPWDLLLICVAVYLAAAVGRVHELFGFLQPFKIPLISGTLALALYALAPVGLRRVALLRGRAAVLLLALAAWMALSVPDALNRGAAFHFWTDNFLKTVLMYFVIVGCVRSVRDVERLTFAYFAATVVYTTVVLARFRVDESNWRLAHLYNYDANDFATLAVSAMPLGLYFALSARSLLVRGGAIGGLCALALGLVWSGSRGGFIALLVTVCFILFRFTTVALRWRVAGLTIIVALVAATASDRYWTQMQTIVNPHEDYNRTSEQGRIQTWQRGIGYMAAHPVLGVGANNFWFAEGTISPLARRQEYGGAVRWGAAHNTLVQVGAELGVPGLLFFIGFLGSIFASLRRAARSASGLEPTASNSPRLAQSLMAALVGFSVGAFFLSLAYAEMLYTLAALAVGLEKVTRYRQHGPSPAGRRAGNPRLPQRGAV